MRLLRLVLAWRSHALHLPAGGLVVVAPHPDDETIGCGGLITRSAREGRDVVVIFLTSGEASHHDHPLHTPPDIGTWRRSEAIAATRHLGVSEQNVSFCDLPDSKLSSLTQDRWNTLETCFERIRADHNVSTVLIPHQRDGSSEHEAAHTGISSVLSALGRSVYTLEYIVWSAYSPRLLARLAKSPGRIHRCRYEPGMVTKCAALREYVSQFDPTAPWNHAVQPPDFIPTVLAATEFYWEHLD